jgi:hypothetical protein
LKIKSVATGNGKFIPIFEEDQKFKNYFNENTEKKEIIRSFLKNK